MSENNYKCIVCHVMTSSVTELHFHQTYYHSSEELSQSIIKFYNFEDYFTVTDAQCSNKENVENQSQVKISLRDSTIVEKDINHNNSQKEHDEQKEPLCLMKSKDETFKNKEDISIYCQQKQSNKSYKNFCEDVSETADHDNFQLRESELNEPFNIIDDDVFFLSINNLCEDLKNPKCRAPRKIKIKKEAITTMGKNRKRGRRAKKIIPKLTSQSQMNIVVKKEATKYENQVINESDIFKKNQTISILNKHSQSYNSDYNFNTNENIFESLGHISVF